MADNSLQKQLRGLSAWPRLIPISCSATPCAAVRLQIEYAKAEERLRAWTVRSTVVVFGSARVRSADGALICPSDHSVRWYEEARRFGTIVSERGGALISDHGIRDNVIATGGGPGHHGGGEPRCRRRRCAIDRL